ncbi:MAG TPA: hypothetical protein VIJ39_10390 [Solirubrobacteraceae bacterium]
MLTKPIALDAVQPGADQDAAVLGVYNAGACIAVAAGVFGFYLAGAEEISPRQRVVGSVAALATSAFGVAALSKPVEMTALLRRELSPWALPALGLLGIAGSAPDRSPMLFPGLILTAFGGGRLGPARSHKLERTASLVLGAGAAGGYLSVVMGTQRPWRSGWRRSLLWNIGMAPTFLAAAPLGGELGDLALTTRRLERTRTRDREALHAAAIGAGRGGLRDVARKIGHTAADLEQTLLRLAARHRTSEDSRSSEVEEALEEVRDDIQHHLLGPILVAAANNEPLDLALTLNAILNLYRAGWREEKISITFDSRLPQGLTLDARITGILVRAAKVALDNCYKHQRCPLREIGVRLSLSEGRVVLRIEDDGGVSDPDDPETWGIGLGETLAHVRGVGGELTLLSAKKGLVLTVSLPRKITDPLAAHVPMTSRIDEALEHCAAVIRPATWFGGVMCLLTARRSRVGVAHALAFNALVGADRLWYRQAPGDPRRARTTLPAISLLWPAGGRPATGWTGLELVALGARGRLSEVTMLGPIVFAITALSARRVRHTLEPGRLRENMTFPLVCAVSGIAAGIGRESLARAEHEALGLRERAELIEQLARAVRLHHDLIKPLRSSAAWYDEGIMESEEGQRLLALSGAIDNLTREMLALIAVADPIRDIQEHLQLRLDPAIVTVEGECPTFVCGAAAETAVSRAREHLAVVALADELADRMLARYPPRLSGRSRLRRLHVHIVALDNRNMRVSVRPAPPEARADHDLGAFEAVLARLPGRLIDGFERGGLTFTVPATALLTQ